MRKKQSKHYDYYAQLSKLEKYKINKEDERIIRRYILILQDTAPKDYLIETVAYLFRTTPNVIDRILSQTSDKEMCEIALIREKWQKNAARPHGGYISRRLLENA